MKIKDAIIILGPGKSGTTLFNNILSQHKDLYWISSYLNKFPKHHYLSILNNLCRIGSFENKTRSKPNYPRPAESFQFWTSYIPNFPSNPIKYNPDEVKNAIKAARNIGRYQHGTRLLIKFTGPSRIDFIQEIFENPYIIWIDRDPKAIVASFYSNKWRYKHKGEDFMVESRTEIIKEYTTYYKWIKEEKDQLKRFPFLHVHYESLVENPIKFFRNICKFSDLEFYPGFENIIESWKIKKHANDKYLKFFSKQELITIDNILSDKEN